MHLEMRLFGALTPEFDYLKLFSLLQDYANPRDQITKLIRSNLITRVKKGIYVLGPVYQKPFSREVLANIVYGPSYISGMSALAYYSLIPERVEVTTSRTPNRNKTYDTPVGCFTYTLLPMHLYTVSIDRVWLDTQRSFLIATKEKALLEVLCAVKDIQCPQDLKDWISAMRVDIDALTKMRIGELESLRRVFQVKQADLFIDYVKQVKK